MSKCPMNGKVKGDLPANHLFDQVNYEEHPGGERNLAIAEKSDRADLLFLSYHLGRDWPKIEKTFALKTTGGVLPQKSKLYEELDASMRQVFAESQGLLLLWRAYNAGLLFALGGLLVAHWLYLSLWTCLGLSFCFISYAFNIFHMRHHMGGRLFGLPWLDQALNPLLDVVDNSFMIPPLVWIRNHQGSHHLYTNHTELDRDIKFPYSVIRLSREYPWRWFHAWQPYYVPVVLALNVPTFPWENFLVNKSNFGYLVLHYLVLVGLGGFFTGEWLRALGMYVTLELITSLAIATLFQVSHNCHSSAMQHEITPESRDLDFDLWFKQQVCESISWGGFWATLFYGGINLQIEHHIAPAVPALLLARLQPHVERICQNHNIPYVKFPTIVRPIYEYFAHLNALSHENNDSSIKKKI